MVEPLLVPVARGPHQQHVFAGLDLLAADLDVAGRHPGEGELWCFVTKELFDRDRDPAGIRDQSLAGGAVVVELEYGAADG